MSLNREEQMVFDYLQAQRDERQFWEDKVRAVQARVARSRATAGRTLGEGAEIAGEVSHDAASRAATSAGGDPGAELERALWEYFVERSQVAEPFRSVAAREGVRRTSLRNLADLLLRLWGPEAKPRGRGPGGV